MKVVLTKEELEKAIMSLPPDILKLSDSSLSRFQDKAGLSPASNVQGDISEQGKDIKAGYSYLSDCNFSGGLQSINNKQKLKLEETGDIYLEGYKIRLSIKDDPSPRLPSSTVKLHKVLLSRAITTKQKKVRITLDEYMKILGLKNRQESKNSLSRDIETLYNISITLESDEYKKATRIVVDYDIPKYKDYVTIQFGDRIYNYGLMDSFGYINTTLLQIDSRKHPNAFTLGDKIWNHLKQNGGIISVKSLLKYCPEIPSYDTVMKEDKHIRARIIDPFDKDLEFLCDEVIDSPIKDYYYVKARGEILTDEERDKLLDYKFWIEMYVHFELSDSYKELLKTFPQKVTKTKKQKKNKY